MELTEKQREMMLHALGLERRWNGKMRRRAYRNRYVVDRDSGDYSDWRQLTEAGFAEDRNYSLAGNTSYFLVKPAGVAALGEDIKRRVPSHVVPWRD